MAKHNRRKFSVLPFLIVMTVLALLVLGTAAACRVGLIQVRGSLSDIFGTAIRERDLSVISAHIYPISTEHMQDYIREWLLLTLRYMLWYAGLLAVGVLPVLLISGYFRREKQQPAAPQPKALLETETYSISHVQLQTDPEEPAKENAKERRTLSQTLSKAVDRTRYGTHDPFPPQTAVVIRLTLDDREYYVTETMPGEDAIYSLAKENALIALDGSGDYHYISFYRHKLRIQYSQESGNFTIRTKGQYLREEPDSAAVLDALTILPGEEKQVCIDGIVLHILITV